MTNLLEAIVNINALENLEVKDFYKSNNRVNKVGDALELFITDAFANTFDKTEMQHIKEAYNKTFSYLASKNHPPDAILRGSDAIEVKKIKSSKASSLQFNSSYPTDKLLSSSPMITKACRQCEEWTMKDIIYAVGAVNERSIDALCLVYGEDYAASQEVYDRMRTTIRKSVNAIPGVEFYQDSNEIGLAKKIDPLKITYLRIRGMWGIQSPFKLFKYLEVGKFFAIINTKKYDNFPIESRNKIENTKGIKIEDCKIQDPNDPKKFKEAKLIRFMEAQ